MDGSTRTDATAYCGINGTGFVEQICEVGAWVNTGCNDGAFCKDGDILDYQLQSISCGANGNGLQIQKREQLCAAGIPADWSTWENYGGCIDDSECIDGTILIDDREISCGLNENGRQVQQRQQSCVGGYWPTTWSGWADIGGCIDSDTCENGSSQQSTEILNCGFNENGYQVRIVEEICRSGSWLFSSSFTNPCVDSDDCIEGSERAVSCGINDTGTQLERCVEGNYGSVGGCIDESVCLDGSSYASVACGINGNGAVTVSCEDGQLVYGLCDDADICLDGSIQHEDISSACGLNSTGREILETEQICTTGTWNSATSGSVAYACFDPAECSDGTTRTTLDSCGINGRGDLEEICRSGRYELQSCHDTEICLDETLVDYELQNVPCSIDGIQFQERSLHCVSGNPGTWSLWENVGSCLESELTIETSTEVPCGINSNGTVTVSCVDGTPVYDSCIDDDVCHTETSLHYETRVGSCGINGNGQLIELRVQQCTDEGMWSGWSAYEAISSCSDPDVCEDGTSISEACGLNDRGILTDIICTGGIYQPGACVDPDVCEDDSTDGPPNSNQDGVCRYSRQHCVEGQWQDSTTDIPNYETDESACDGLDNDCDTLVDEGPATSPCSLDQLLGYWSFDEGSGSTARDTGAGSYDDTGEITGSVDWVAGRREINSALRFSGGKVNINDSPDLQFASGNFSISYWMKLEGAPSKSDLFMEKYDGPHGSPESKGFYAQGDGTNLDFLFYDGTVGANVGLTGDTLNDCFSSWCFFTAVIDRNSCSPKVTSYVNTTLNQETSVLLGSLASSATLYFGAVGSIDEVKFFSCALSPDLIDDEFDR